MATSDPRQVPLYGIGEAARYLRIPPMTLRSWVLGRPHKTLAGPRRWPNVITLPDSRDPRLSYSNLIEAHVLRSLRIEHDIAVKHVREAIQVAARQCDVDRLLLSGQLRAAAGQLFLETYAELIALNASGQIAIRAVFEQHLARIEWVDDLPVRLFPIYGGAADDSRGSISIAAGISSGRPVIARRGVRTAVIVDRLDAGESQAEISADFDLEVAEVIEAATYERAA